MLLAPEVTCSLLEVLVPVLVGTSGWQQLLRLIERPGGGQLSPHLTLVDDGRLAGGLLESPFDGEGVPTDRVVLIAAGEPKQPVLPWWEGAAAGRASGCSLRAGWRELPQAGVTHLYIEPEPKRPVASLLEALTRGYYFVATAGEPRIDLDQGRFVVAVRGFVVRGGRAERPISSALLGGSVRRLLAGVQATGRDLRFVPQRRIFGAPSLLVSGLEIDAP